MIINHKPKIIFKKKCGGEGYFRERSPLRRNSRERTGGWNSSAISEVAAELKAAKDEAAKDKAALEKTVLEMEKKRKASEAEKEALNEQIFLLLPPKSVKNDYVEQNPAKFIFRCSDGDIQIPEYGILQTEFYYKERIISYKLHLL